MKDLNQRWNIQLSNAEEQRILKNRLKLILDDIQVSSQEAGGLAFDLGLAKDAVIYQGYDYRSYVKAAKLIDGAATPYKLAAVLEALIDNVPDFSSLADDVARLVNDSNCEMVMKQVDGHWLTYPAGEKNLDEEIVNKPLSFLKDSSLNEYTKALEHYSQGKWEESAEKTRRALEEYLRQRTATGKGLDQLIGLVANSMKAKKQIPDHLRNTINAILRTLDTNYNESSKHNSKTYGKVEAEFLIYQTGLLMRLLSQLEL